MAALAEVRPHTHPTHPERTGSTESLKSKTFSLAYTPKPFEGAYSRPFTRGKEKITSGEPLIIKVSEGAFTIPQEGSPLYEHLETLCTLDGVKIDGKDVTFKPPTSQAELETFVASQLQFTNSKGHPHLENDVFFLLFPPSGQEQAARDFLISKSLQAPEKPDGCAEMEGTLPDGQEINIHLHSEYHKGNNKRVLTMFALLGHEPSIALLEKWVTNDPQFKGRSGIDVAFKMADVILDRKREGADGHAHDHPHEHEAHEEKDLDELVHDSVTGVADALVRVAKTMSEHTKLPEEFVKLQQMEFFGQPDINQKLSPELQALVEKGKNVELSKEQEKRLKMFEKNRETTDLVREILTQVRQEHKVDTANEQFALLLLQMLKPSLKKVTFDGELPEYKKLTSDDAMRVLSLAMEIRTRKDPTPVDEREKRILQYEAQLLTEGITYVFHGNKHVKGKMHMEWDSLKGGYVHCPETTPEIAKDVQKIQESIAKQMQPSIVSNFRQPLNHRLFGGGIPPQNPPQAPFSVSSPRSPEEPSVTKPPVPASQSSSPSGESSPRRSGASVSSGGSKARGESSDEIRKPRVLRVYHEMASTGDVLTTPAHVVGKREDADMVIRVAASNPTPDASATRLSSEVSGLKHKNGARVGVAKRSSGPTVRHEESGEHVLTTTGTNVVRSSGEARGAAGQTTGGHSESSSPSSRTLRGASPEGAVSTETALSGRPTAGGSSTEFQSSVSGRTTGSARGDGGSEGSHPTDKPKGKLNPYESAGTTSSLMRGQPKIGDTLAQVDEIIAANKVEQMIREAGQTEVSGIQGSGEQVVEVRKVRVNGKLVDRYVGSRLEQNTSKGEISEEQVDEAPVAQSTQMNGTKQQQDRGTVEEGQSQITGSPPPSVPQPTDRKQTRVSTKGGSTAQAATAQLARGDGRTFPTDDPFGARDALRNLLSGLAA